MGVTAADAEKKDPEQFEIWRKDPANFSFDGRYPLLEVYDKAKEAWKGVSASYQLCLSHNALPMPRSLFIHCSSSVWFDYPGLTVLRLLTAPSFLLDGC